MAYFEENSEAMLALEAMIDRAGIRNVLYALAHIAGEKSEHVAVNWQDMPLAKQWDKAAQSLSNMAEIYKGI
jgi:hypothetical protein